MMCEKDEGLKTFIMITKMCYVRSVSLPVKKKLHENVVVPTAMYEAEIWSRTAQQWNKLDLQKLSVKGISAK